MPNALRFSQATIVYEAYVPLSGQFPKLGKTRKNGLNKQNLLNRMHLAQRVQRHGVIVQESAYRLSALRAECEAIPHRSLGFAHHSVATANRLKRILLCRIGGDAAVAQTVSRGQLQICLNALTKRPLLPLRCHSWPL